MRGIQAAETQIARAAGCAWNAQIHGIAHISAELDLMVATHLGPIVDELELLFVLDERAVADIAKRRYETQDEPWQTRRKLIACI